MTSLSTRFPDDLWGKNARKLARDEAQAIHGGGWFCEECSEANDKRREWCAECGRDRP